MTALSPIAAQIWDMKYRFKEADGTVCDASIDDTWRRVAGALAQAEKDSARWTPAFLDALTDYKFLPAGRILAGAGTGRTVTLFNCFVMGAIEDSMGGIFEAVKEAALTMQQGGGIGYDFSTLRPKGTLVRGVGADASGPLSFMDVWDSMCRTIMSAGSRRGAMMATMRCDHPDIEDFIDAKRDPSRLRMFNLSVLVTDPFMDAMKADGPWDLVFKGAVHRTVRARDLWDRIMRSTYDYAEPGVIFIDRINRRNNLHYCETIQATNPCGEQPLPPYGTCLLGSLNLTRFVRHPFTPKAALDEAALAETTATAVRMMDNVIDVSNYPLEAQRREAETKRRIGLGITGLADALIMVGARYDREEGRALAGSWAKALRDAAYAASVELAREKGAFPLFDPDAYGAGETIQELPRAIQDGIAKYGIRNALLTSIAPTGTISLFADNVSSGIEPVFSFSYTRNVLMPDGTRKAEEVSDYAYRLFRAQHGADAPLPEAFVDALSLDPAAHVAMQAAVQPYVDSAISKTINVPEDIGLEAFKNVYAQAYEGGCKGCTTYRPNDITGAVLEAPSRNEAEPEPVAEEAPPAMAYPSSSPMPRPEVLPGITYKLKWPDIEQAMYITLNDVVVDGQRRPFEIFINSRNMEHYAWTVGLTRMISAVFRRGGDLSFVVEELKAIFDPRGGAWMGGRYVPSILAAIGDVIERHMRDIGLMMEEDEALVAGDRPEAKVVMLEGRRGMRACPKCGAAALVRSEGCDTCTGCGYSKCG